MTNPENPWYAMRDPGYRSPNNPDLTCRRRNLETDVLEYVVDHEQDHVDLARTWFGQNNINERLEGIVLQANIQDVLNATGDSIMVASDEQDAANTAQVHANLPDFPCQPLGFAPI